MWYEHMPTSQIIIKRLCDNICANSPRLSDNLPGTAQIPQSPEQVTKSHR